MNIEKGEYRVSKTVWLQKDETPGVERQLANLTHIASGKIEDLQTVYYPNSGYYFVHHDCDTPFEAGPHPHRDFARLLTLLIYLTDVNEENGGQTNFPLSDSSQANVEAQFASLLETGKEKGDKASSRSKGWQQYGRNTPIFQTIPKSIMPQSGLSTCSKGLSTTNLAAGDAVLFYNILPQANMDGRLDLYALHAGCGVNTPKWLVNSWRWNQPNPGGASSLHDEL